MGAHVTEARGRAENDGVRLGHLLRFGRRQVGKGLPRGLGACTLQSLVWNQLRYLVELRVGPRITRPAATSSAIV